MSPARLRTFALSALAGLAWIIGGSGVVRANQESAEHIERGRINERAQAFEDAIREYQAALAADPHSTAAMFNLGRMYAYKHQFQEAVDWYARVVALDPNDGEAHYHLAMTLTALKDFTKAVAYYDRAKELGHTNDPVDLEGVLRAYRHREMALEMDSLGGQRMTVRIIGNPLGDDGLKRDTLRTIEILEHGFDPATLRGIRVEFVGWQGETTSLERWIVQTAAGERAYVVTYTQAPGGGTDFNVTEAPPAQPAQPPEGTEAGRPEL